MYRVIRKTIRYACGVIAILSFLWFVFSATPLGITLSAVSMIASTVVWFLYLNDH